ncbi:MAG TPA: hypothetical protein VKG44_05410 [Candidatus Baltobacteraceae bacterium]|nr:hypothetical protein [Candidatus Baltobacteraceae bacterium]
MPKASASPAADVPQILEVDLNDSHLQAHGHIQMRVLTSPDVVKVISRSNGHEGTLTQAAPGEFLGSGNVPGIPFIAKGWKVNLEFIATNAEGKNVSVKVPVTLD